MNTNHTPGPWNWHGPYRTGAFKVSALADDGSQTIDVMIDRSDDNGANARLIAAAPDLLAALQTLATCVDSAGLRFANPPGMPEVATLRQTALRNAFNAIARAKGEAS